MTLQSLSHERRCRTRAFYIEIGLRIGDASHPRLNKPLTFDACGLNLRRPIAHREDSPLPQVAVTERMLTLPDTPVLHTHRRVWSFVAG